MPIMSKEEIMMTIDSWDYGVVPLSTADRINTTHIIWSFQRGFGLDGDILPTVRTDRVHKLVSVWYAGRHIERLRNGEPVFKEQKG